jgi:hypothetical protein
VVDTSGKLKRKERKKGDDLPAELAEWLATCAPCMGENPSPDDVSHLKTYLLTHPDAWRNAGELSAEALKRTVENESWSAYQRECVMLGLEELRANLGYEQSNHIERLLIDQAVLCWVRLYFLEDCLSRATKGTHNRESGLYWDRRVTSAQHRYTQALVALAKVRKLKLPDITAIQANVAIVNASESPTHLQTRAMLQS